MIRTSALLLRRAGRACATAALGLLLVTAPATAQAPATGQPRPGGTLRIGFAAEPNTLNPYFDGSRGAALSELTLDSLARGAPDGSYLPVLAAEIPTQANGDISADGTVMTWKLRPGVTWSDGQSFSSQDVVFTYQMIMDSANPVLNRSDYVVMDSVTAPDDNTVVVTYKQLYAPYRVAFPYIFPVHVFNGQTNIAQDPFNQGSTIGTGPFVFKSGSPGDTWTFDRNPNYREPGKPYLDEVVVKITPGRDAEMQALAASDVDAASFLDSTYLSQLATLPDVSVDPAPASVLPLLVNTACSSGPQQGDPTCPHPVLGDLRVRQAIELAIDKQTLVHGLLADRVKVAGSVLPVGPFAVDLPPSEFSPDKAQQLLDQAGWVVSSDGVRSKGGVRAHLTFIIPVGDTVDEETAQVIAGDLLSVGIETEIKELSGLAFGFAGNSALTLGNFDLALWNLGIPIDPQAALQTHYASDQVPNAQLQTGQNFSRMQDTQLDQALAAAGNTLDDAQRKAAYVSFSERVRADEAVIPLFPNLQVDARMNYVEGWGQTNVNDYLSWNIQNWWLNQ
jgi:peptide/nickel transport system substrate-binding protein